MRCASFATAAALVVACTNEATVPDPETVANGTWGGDQAALMVADTTAHVHVGCTFGYFRAPIRLQSTGRFNVAGSYVLRAYPVQIGPALPAELSGSVEGARLTFRVTVNDTVARTQVVLGPATVTWNREPRMGPCPICIRAPAPRP